MFVNDFSLASVNASSRIEMHVLGEAESRAWLEIGFRLGFTC
jgi:hypothetical protein